MTNIRFKLYFVFPITVLTIAACKYLIFLYIEKLKRKNLICFVEIKRGESIFSIVNLWSEWR
jgi:hypothetical protein